MCQVKLSENEDVKLSRFSLGYYSSLSLSLVVYTNGVVTESVKTNFKQLL